MIEVYGDLWTYPADVRVITTNGFVKKNGEAVMGRGCALEAANQDSNFPLLLGHHIKINGNVVGMIGVIDGLPILSFPVKHNWYEKADLELILKSAKALKVWADYAEEDGPIKIVLPRPGCGNGGLKWEVVKPILEPILDDRFHVITFSNQQAMNGPYIEKGKVW